MKILLLNNNPVVNKLVTLSAQKTGDNLAVADCIEAVQSQNYDLLIVDDALYSSDIMDQLQGKIEYTKSLFVCSRDATAADEFDAVLRKPFLPTDLVELLASFSRSIAPQNKSSVDKELFKPAEPVEDVDDFGHEIEDLGSFDDLEEIDIIDAKQNNLKIDEFDDMDDFEGSLDVDDSFDDLDALEGFEDIGEEDSGVLDKDDLKEVQTLLDETESDDDFDFDTHEEIAIEEPKEETETYEDELGDFSFDEAEDETEEQIEPEEIGIEEDFDVEDDSFSEEKTHIEPEEIGMDEDFESKIQDALGELTQEDLDTELDEDVFLDIDTLSSRDLKLAIGEEVEDVAIDGEDENLVESFEEMADEDAKEDEEIACVEDNGNVGVETLKKLLEALLNKDIAASLQGKKISINITIG